jgi:glucosamine-6-phosphate deaminase
MRVIIQPNYELVSSWVAAYVVRKIRDFKPSPGKPFVLGLPTGSSPVGTYKELIEFHKKGMVSFKNVVTFNMDEYIGIPEDHPESYHSFMWNNFFKHVDIQKKNVNILNGNAKNLEKECADTRVNLNDMTKIIETYQKITGLTIIVRGVCNDDNE